MWTEEEKQILINNHGKLTLPQISKLLPIPKSYTCIRGQAQRLGLFRHKKTGISLPIKNTFNMNYWDNLTLINCFIAGEIAGDGCLLFNKTNQTHTFHYKCSVKDEYIVDTIIKEMNFSGKKCYSFASSPSYPDRIGKFVTVNFSGGFDNNAAKLKEYFNLSPNKTLRLGPTNIKDDNLNLAYFIGLIDSDGSVEAFLDRQYIRISFSINSCSFDIVNWTKNLLDRNFPHYSDREPQIKVVEKENRNIFYQYYVSGLRAAVILDYLSQFPVPKLHRKWYREEVLENIQYFKNKCPQYFKSPTFTL